MGLLSGSFDYANVVEMREATLSQPVASMAREGLEVTAPQPQDGPCLVAVQLITCRREFL